jgi:hypothetical protein
MLARSGLLERRNGCTGDTGCADKKRRESNAIQSAQGVTIQGLEVVSLVTDPALFPSPDTTVTTASNAVVPRRDARKYSDYQGLSHSGTSETSETIQTQPEVPQEPDPAEREAIAIELGRVPEPYARDFGLIQANLPADVPRDRWNLFIDDAGLFFDAWGQKALLLGWSASDLFGLEPLAPMARYDCMGLLWLLKGARVVSLTSTEARLSDGLTYYRHPP